jgi:hypothetical protein
MEYIAALVSPFFILLIENFLPYPYVIEELFKFFLAKWASSTKVAVILGLLFSISEAIFYSMNPNAPLYRILFVAPMHITTILIMQYFSNVIQLRHKKNLWPVGLLLAILIHYLFNQIGLAGSEPVM